MMHHGTSITLNDAGILIQGPSGAGKSDLALQMLDRGARLIADDYTLVEATAHGGLALSAPEKTRGLIEVRGLGIVSPPDDKRATGVWPLALLVQLVPRMDMERFPDKHFCDFMGQQVPRIILSIEENSCAAKLSMAMDLILNQRWPPDESAPKK